MSLSTLLPVGFDLKTVIGERRNGALASVIDRLELARGLWGAGLILAPRKVTRVLLRRDVSQRIITVVRILGVRQCLQALITMPKLLRRLRPLGGVVDILHSLSMVGIAMFSLRHRRAALTSATVAATFALLELRSRRSSLT